jgi:hypothetical protein
MHAKKIVDEALGSCLSSLHAKLAIAFKEAVCGVLRGGRLSLSQLARALEPTTTMRHRIKRIDRMLGNFSLYRARQEVYRQVAAQWLEGIEQILVVVDWSDATLDQKWHLLRASVALEGRSVTLYEEVHPQRKLGNRLVHRAFLARVAKLLPAGCRPIIMTDAGFHSTWFELVTLRGWQWVGRIRGKDMVSIDGSPWKRCTVLYPAATSRAKGYGNAHYVRSHPTLCRLVLVKRKPKGRTHRNRLGKKSRAHASSKAARRAREPWLLASSPGLEHLTPESIVSLYAQRMRIEQSFRDVKNERLGLGLSASRSRSGTRLEILLMIGHLAAWLMRLIGEFAQQHQMHLQFQSVAHPKHKEISTQTLARRILDAGGRWLDRLRPREAINIIRQQAMRSCQTAC